MDSTFFSNTPAVLPSATQQITGGFSSEKWTIGRSTPVSGFTYLVPIFFTSTSPNSFTFFRFFSDKSFTKLRPSRPAPHTLKLSSESNTRRSNARSFTRRSVRRGVFEHELFGCILHYTCTSISPIRQIRSSNVTCTLEAPPERSSAHRHRPKTDDRNRGPKMVQPIR